MDSLGVPSAAFFWLMLKLDCKEHEENDVQNPRDVWRLELVQKGKGGVIRDHFIISCIPLNISPCIHEVQ